MRFRLVSLAALCVSVVSLLVAPALAGKLGRKLADSGSRRGAALLHTKIYGRKVVFFKGTTNPRQQITGTWSVNCVLGTDTAVYHDEGGLPLIPSGVVVKKIKLPHKDFDYCWVTPWISIVGDGTQPVGTARMRIFVRPLPGRR